MFFWKWSIGEKYEKSLKFDKNKKNILQENILFHRESKREDIDTKLSEREMVAQIGLNPFFQTSYESDIANYDNCMKLGNKINK